MEKTISKLNSLSTYRINTKKIIKYDTYSNCNQKDQIFKEHMKKESIQQ